MQPIVEPLTGPELDRLITALLNATGVVHQVIGSVGPQPGRDGEEIIGIVAERLRQMLAVLSEHNSDEELAHTTRLLAEMSILVAAELGLEDVFRPD